MDGRTDGRTDGADCNISEGFFFKKKKRGDKHSILLDLCDS